MACNAGAIVLQQVRHSNALGPVFGAFLSGKTHASPFWRSIFMGRWTLRPPAVGLSLSAGQPGQQNFQ
jgi:hypothetical protein